MRLSSTLRITAPIAAFFVPLLIASCQEVTLFPLPDDGGEDTTSAATTTTTTGAGGASTTATTTTTTTTGTTGSGGAGGASTTATTTGTTGSGGAGGATGSGGAGSATTTAGSGGAGGVAASDAGADDASSGAGGTGGAGGMAESDAGADDAMIVDDAGAHDATDDALAIDDGGSDAATCVSNTFAFPLAAGAHVAMCSVIDYATNPPTSGPHYPVWAAFKVYKDPVPRGFLVHSLEHGAVVFSYNCPDGCAAELDALATMLAARPVDPGCVPPLTGRYIVTPDPLLDARFAASAWGFALKADCMDVAAMSAFTDAHYAMAPENFCFDGTNVLDPAFNLPPGCGAPLSDAGTD